MVGWRPATASNQFFPLSSAVGRDTSEWCADIAEWRMRPRPLGPCVDICIGPRHVLIEYWHSGRGDMRPLPLVPCGLTSVWGHETCEMCTSTRIFECAYQVPASTRRTSSGLAPACDHEDAPVGKATNMLSVPVGRAGFSGQQVMFPSIFLPVDLCLAFRAPRKKIMLRRSSAAQFERENTCGQEFSTAPNTHEPLARAWHRCSDRGAWHHEQSVFRRQESKLATMKKACVAASAQCVP